MQISEVKKKAEGLGLRPGKMGKIDLIHVIQNEEGNRPCFQTGLNDCDQFNCCWRSDCLPSNSENKKKSKRDVYLEKIKVESKYFNDKIDNLKVRAKRMAGKSKTEALEEIKHLEKKFQEEIIKKVQKVTREGEELWQPTKKSIDASWKDFKKAVQETLSRFGNVKR